MASWMTPYGLDGAADSDPALGWPALDGIMAPEDALGHGREQFGPFTEFSHIAATNTTSLDSLDSLDRASSTAARFSQSIFVNPSSSSSSSSAERPASSAVSPTGDADYFFGPNPDFLDPSRDFPVSVAPQQHFHHHQLHPRSSCTSLLFDSALQRFGKVSLHSPIKMEHSLAISQPPVSPTLQTTATTKRQSKKIVEAISSTIKKAAHLRKGRKQAPPVVERSASPTLEHPPMAIRDRRAHMDSLSGTSGSTTSSTSAPYNHPQYSQSAGFIHGYCDDPFAELFQAHHPLPLMYFGHDGNGVDHHVTKSEHGCYQTTSHSASPKAVIGAGADGLSPGHMAAGSWPSQHMMATSGSIPHEAWSDPTVSGFATGHEQDWWDSNVFSDVKSPSSSHQALQSHHMDLSYEYEYADPMLGSVVLVPMPQPSPLHPGQDQVPVQQAYLPPPPPIPMTNERGRSSRPPRARSSGARHKNPSPSPMRKTRGPSASPKLGTQSQSQPQLQSQPQAQTQTQTQAHQRRHSSTGSISSARSASGRGNGSSAPGTPGGNGVRKRRSRDAGLLCSSGDDMGFVNFTPSDGSLLMTGVAPSGSSKTKARREKEALERRRKLSEAAMKAVVAAGGDVDKLIQEGFVL